MELKELILKSVIVIAALAAARVVWIGLDSFGLLVAAIMAALSAFVVAALLFAPAATSLRLKQVVGSLQEVVAEMRKLLS